MQNKRQVLTNNKEKRFIANEALWYAWYAKIEAMGQGKDVNDVMKGAVCSFEGFAEKADGYRNFATKIEWFYWMGNHLCKLI